MGPYAMAGGRAACLLQHGGNAEGHGGPRESEWLVGRRLQATATGGRGQGMCGDGPDRRQPGSNAVGSPAIGGAPTPVVLRRPPRFLRVNHCNVHPPLRPRFRTHAPPAPPREADVGTARKRVQPFARPIVAWPYATPWDAGKRSPRSCRTGSPRLTSTGLTHDTQLPPVPWAKHGGILALIACFVTENLASRVVARGASGVRATKLARPAGYIGNGGHCSDIVTFRARVSRARLSPRDPPHPAARTHSSRARSRGDGGISWAACSTA